MNGKHIVCHFGLQELHCQGKFENGEESQTKEGQFKGRTTIEIDNVIQQGEITPYLSFPIIQRSRPHVGSYMRKNVSWKKNSICARNKVTTQISVHKGR